MSRLPLHFRIIQNGKLVREETLSLSVIKLGKVPSAHLRIEDESISRMHAILEVDAKGVVSLIDLGSTRGTFVNGQKINKATIQSGDVITLGEARIEVAFGAPEAVAIDAPAPAPLAKVIVMPTPVAAPAVIAAIAAPVAPPVPPPVAKPTPAYARPMPAPFATMASPLGLQAAMAESTEDASAQAIEVAAMLGDSVVSVKHCMNPRSGKVTAATWGFVGLGAAALLTSAVAFSTAYAAASRNKSGLDYWTHVQNRPAHAFRPEESGPITDALSFGGLALGLAAATIGLARARRERRSPFYRIGTAPGVELALDSAPTADFPLIAPRGDEFVLNFSAGMDGEMVIDGISTQLAALPSLGRARASSSVAGAIEIPIPLKARIRARAGNTTFLVSSVAKPRESASPLIAVSGMTMACLAGSLVLHLGLYGAMQLASDGASGVTLNMPTDEQLGMTAQLTAKDDEPPPPTKDDDQGTDTGGQSDGGQTAMAEGVSGKPDSKNAEGHMRIENRNAPPQISRAEAIEQAREAGIMGSTQLSTAIGMVAGEPGNITSGFDATTVYGGLFGPEGESFGTGTGRFGNDLGGGCTINCGGYGAGQYRTIGQGHGTGDGYVPGGNGTGKPMHRTAAVPTVTFSHPTDVSGGLDREIIKRYVKRQALRIGYCYEKQLLATPELEGDVVVQFLVMPNGTVSTANGAGMNNDVAACVADAIHDIAFPAPSDGGSVQVKYPFHFHPAGHGG